MSQLVKVTCRGCEAPFYVYPEAPVSAENAEWCDECVAFRAAMQHLYRMPDPISIQAERRARWRVLSFVGMVALCLAGWGWLVWRLLR